MLLWHKWMVAIFMRCMFTKQASVPPPSGRLLVSRGWLKHLWVLNVFSAEKTIRHPLFGLSKKSFDGRANVYEN